jgi:hypothetical protein
MRKDDAVGNKKKMQVCLPKHDFYKLDNNLLTVEPRAVDPHCFDADADPDPDPGGGGGVGQPKMCIPPGKILGTPLSVTFVRNLTHEFFPKKFDPEKENLTCKSNTKKIFLRHSAY